MGHDADLSVLLLFRGEYKAEGKLCRGGGQDADLSDPSVLSLGVRGAGIADPPPPHPHPVALVPVLGAASGPGVGNLSAGRQGLLAGVGSKSMTSAIECLVSPEIPPVLAHVCRLYGSGDGGGDCITLRLE